MKSRRMVSGLVAVIAVVVGSSLMIPAAVGAAPHTTKTTAVSCTAKGSKPLGNTGVVAVSVKGGVTTGTPGHCAAKLTGKWAKNSTTFSLSGSGKATLTKTGAWTMAPGTDLSPLKGAKLSGTLQGTGLPAGTALYIRIDCVISYPPLKIVCTITIGTSSGAAPRAAVHAPAPQITTGSTLCKATGTKPLGNTGVVSVALKNSNSPGAADICRGTITGKWKKNSTAFSVSGSGKATLGKGGAWKSTAVDAAGVLTNGKLAGTVTGSGATTGTNITVDWGCNISYPPLKIKCWIIVSAA